MKQRVTSVLMRGGVFYTWYRFDQASNYITFNQWCIEYPERMTEKQMIEFLKLNEKAG